MPTESTRFCDRWLVIQGNLDGADFSDATLRCVVLINEMPRPSSKLIGAVQHADNGPTPPEYAGIKFVKSNLENVILLSGNFVFSDFWEARVVRMWVNLPSVDLSFSSLGKLQCSPKGCEIMVLFPNNNFSHLSLSARGSRIRSNMKLSNFTTNQPALLCDNQTEWMMDPASEPGMDVTCNDATMFLELTQKKPKKNDGAPPTGQAAINNEDGRR